MKMAASMEQSESKEEDANGNGSEEELNVLSARFDPLKALYSSKVCLPVDDASCFNNIAEYESFMSKTKSASRAAAQKSASADQQEKPGRDGHGQASGSGSDAASVRRQRGSSLTLGLGSSSDISAREFEKLHAQRMREKTQELPKSTRFQKKRFQGNVLSHMNDAKGPLDLLRQCVEKRCKVRVCVRSLKGLRSICIGYLVAFDKMLNMALMDVDEIYKRPSTGKRFHHEEKLTYSMILANLNPQKRKEEPEAILSRGKASKSEKDCKFCRIMHETIMEQRAMTMQGAKPSKSETGDSAISSSSDDDVGSFSSSSSGSESVSSSGGQGSEVKGQGRIRRAAGRHAVRCPNGHKREGTLGEKSAAGSGKPQKDFSSGTGHGDEAVQECGSGAKDRESVDPGNKVTTLPTVPDRKPLQLEHPTAVSSRISVKTPDDGTESLSTLKTSANEDASVIVGGRGPANDTVISGSEHKTLEGAVFKRPATKSSRAATKSAIPSEAALANPSSHSAGLSAASTLPSKFSQVLTLNPKEAKVTPRVSRVPDTSAEQTRMQEKKKKEKVRIDPGSGRRLIQPEEFKRRHVNQLFLRGDNVVLVSVDSGMVAAAVPQPGRTEET